MVPGWTHIRQKPGLAAQYPACMTQTADPAPQPGVPIPVRRPPRPSTTPATVADLCPLLLADEGAWRSATAAREHRCAALGPDIALTLDKQRRLCLVAAHRTCATYGAAMRLGGDDQAPRAQGASAARPYPRMAPVRLDHGRLGTTVPRVRATRPGNGLLLAGLMVLAFGVIALTRLTGGAELGGVAGATSQPVGAATASPAAETAVPATPVPPTATPAPAPTVRPTAVPSPSRTYTVRRGDTLSGIAAEFDTTVKAIMDLNGISDARQLRVGAVLELP